MHQTRCSFLLVHLAASTSSAEVPSRWETISTEGEPTAQHEAALVGFEGKIDLPSGRRIKPVDVFDPTTNQWPAKSSTPLELHHFQGVVVRRIRSLAGSIRLLDRLLAIPSAIHSGGLHFLRKHCSRNACCVVFACRVTVHVFAEFPK